VSIEIVNPVTGEALIRAADPEDERSWGLLFDLQAVGHVEELLGRSVMDFFAEISSHRPGVKELRALIMAGSEGYRRRNRLQKTLTPNAALEVVQAAGGLAEVLPVVIESMMLAEGLGLAEKEEAAGDRAEEVDARPPGLDATS
jgi:hypothetical protein